MRGYRRRIFPIILVILVICTNIAGIQPQEADSSTYYFALDGIVSGGGTRVDAFYLMREHLAQAGILLNIRNLDWPSYVGEIIAFYNFDITYLGLSGGGLDPDFTGVYNEDGSLNMFGYHTSMDWDEDLGTGVNEWYMIQGTQIMPPQSEERIQHYWEWQEYLMDKICPILPMFSPKGYNAHWANLNGYNMAEGILQSWGKMSWTGLHVGQESVNELVITDAAWSDLNPLFQDDSSSSFISSACLDRLFWFDSDKKAWPHLAKSFEMINDTHVRIVMRDGVKWGDDPDGYSTNEFVDAHDVYMTIFANLEKSSDRVDFWWLDDMVLIDDKTIDLFIDGDLGTEANEPDPKFLEELSLRILPEYYLNQTQLFDGVTPDITHSSWYTFATNCFGSGLFEISEFHEGLETILTLRPDSWWLNDTITSDPALDWANRFGDFSSDLNQLRIRIIPDLQTSLQEFEAGKVDIEGVGWNRDKRTDFEASTSFKVQSDTHYSFSFVAFNMRENRGIIGNRDPCPFDPSMTIGLAIRKAICYAIDRVEINNVLHYGEYQIYNTPLYPKLGIWNNPNIIVYNHDLCKVREYLFKTGFFIIECTPSVAIENGIYSIATISMLTIFFLLYRRKKKK